MLDFQPLFEFSRQNCVAICSFLVPANLIATTITLILVITNRSLFNLRFSMGIGSIMAIALFLHVSTWFIIGVITPVTFILLGLGATCLVTDVLAFIYRQEISRTISTRFSRG